tara:strand:- start:1584 stop:2189 length:606 start_codon:yes stop_codon:yes gene_type:complete
VIYRSDDILNLDKVKRINLINSITGIKSANLIATKSKENHENVAIFSSVIHLGSKPPIVGFVLRPQNNKKTDTYKNILNTSFLTINSVSESFVEKAHSTSSKLSFGQSEFKELKIDQVYLKDFYAPFVKSSIIKIGLKFSKDYILPNKCILVVGDVVLLSVEDEFILPSGHIDLDNSKIQGISGVDTYYSLKTPKKLKYVK